MKIKKFIPAIVAVGFACLMLPAFGQTTQALPPLDPQVRTGKLPNGFTYYIRHNTEPKNRVIFYLANKVGSILENDDQQGLAHFTEHMSFDGTTHFPKSELLNYLQKSGVRFGADLNAYTSFDETVYQLPLPSDKPELLAHGLQIMRDWAQEATLDSVEIMKERGVVLEEKRLGKGANERMQRTYWPLILNHSRYAVRLPIGTDDVLNNFKPATIRSFYKDWYRPDLQSLIIVGDINVDEMEKNIVTQFSDLKNPANERPRIPYTVALTGKNQFSAVTDKEMTATVAFVLIKQPQLAMHTTEDYRKSIIRDLFNSMISNRYDELQRQPSPPFIEASVNVGDFYGGLDQCSMTVVAQPGQLENAFKALWRESEKVNRYGFTQTELDRAKQSYLNNMEASLKEKGKTGSDSYVNSYLQNFLKGTVTPGIDYEYNLVKSDLPGINLDEVNAVGRQSIKNTDRDILILGPEKDKSLLPDEDKVGGWIKDVLAEKLLPYHDDVSTKPLLIAEPHPGKVISVIKDTALNMSTLTLSNGVKVILKPTDFKDNEILFTSNSPGGTSLYSDADFQSADRAGWMIPSFGVGNYNTSQLQKYLSGKIVNVSPYIAERAQGISGSAAPGDLETAFSLMYAYFTEPNKDAGQFQSIISRSKAELANRSSDPGSVFHDTVTAVLSNYNVRRTGPTTAKLDQVDLDKVYKIYKQRFASANGMTFTFVGNFNNATITPLIEKYLGSLPSNATTEEAKDLQIHIPPGKITKTVYKGSEPKAVVNLVWSGVFDYSAAEKINMDALKECLEIRLIERLRKEESGVYTPGVYANNSKYPSSRFSFIVVFGCAPENVEKLVAATQDEINALINNGPLQVNIDKWKAESLRVHETELRNNDWWLNYINGQNMDKEDIHQLNNFNAELDKVTTPGLKQMAAKYLNGSNFIRLVLLPETNPKPSF